jgi:hypothetical protein
LAGVVASAAANALARAEISMMLETIGLLLTGESSRKATRVTLAAASTSGVKKEEKTGLVLLIINLTFAATQ